MMLKCLPVQSELMEKKENAQQPNAVLVTRALVYFMNFEKKKTCSQ